MVASLRADVALRQADSLIQHSIAHTLAAAERPSASLKKIVDGHPCTMHRAVRLTLKNFKTVRSVLPRVHVCSPCILDPCNGRNFCIVCNADGVCGLELFVSFPDVWAEPIN